MDEMGEEVTLLKVVLTAYVFFISPQKKEGTKYQLSQMHNIVPRTH